MDLPPSQAQVSRCHLQSDEMLAICSGVSGEGPYGSAFTIDGRRWTFAVTIRGSAVTVKLRSTDLAADEIGVAHVKIVDRRWSPPLSHSTVHSVVSRGQNCALQLPSMADLVDSGLIIDDSLAITIGAYVLPSPPKKPSLLSQDLGQILESGVGSDITFRVGEEDFPAHRTIIGARSAALAAVIPAPPQASVAVEGEIEPKAFGAFLKFIYTGDLPGAPEILGEAYTKESGCRMSEALFVVADRYDHEQMKGILEERMITQLDPSTAARTLAFAELYGRQQLQSN